MLGEDVHPRDAQVAAPFLHLDHDVGRPHEDDVEPRVPDDRRLVLPVAGPPDLVAGRLQELDDPFVEVALGGDRQADFRCPLSVVRCPLHFTDQFHRWSRCRLRFTAHCPRFTRAPLHFTDHRPLTTDY